MQQSAKSKAHQAKPWLERLARLGFLAKGAVYLTVGVLAAQAAFGSGGKTTDTQGAVQTISRQPFGQVLLLILSPGLISYALWRFMQAALNPADREVARGAFVASGVIHAALAVTAVGLLLGSGGGGGGGSTEQDVTARLSAVPFGRFLLGLVGLTVLGASVFQFIKAYRADFQDALKLGEMSAAAKRWATRAGRLGYAVRGVVFALIGIFFMRAALQSDASEARGLGGTLSTLQGQPYGPYLLGLTCWVWW